MNIRNTPFGGAPVPTEPEAQPVPDAAPTLSGQLTAQPEPSAAADDLRRVLGPKPEEMDETLDVTETSPERAFFESHRNTMADIGLTGLESYQMSLGEPIEVQPEDEDILEAMIIDGYYAEEYTIGRRGSFELRTVGPGVLNDAMQALANVVGQDRITNAAMVAMGAARMLYKYNGQLTFSEALGFNNIKAIEERIRLVMKMPVPVVDIINERAAGFSNRMTLVTSRNTQNFSGSRESGRA